MRLRTRLARAALILLPVLALAALLATQYRETLQEAAVDGVMRTGSDKFVPLRDGRVHYRRYGVPGKSPVLLLHGMNSSLYAWEDVAVELAKSNDVIALDLPFHGLTGAIETHACTPLDVAKLVREFAAALKVAKFTLVGHSTGGQIAIELVKLAPESVDKLVLMDTTGMPVPLTPVGQLLNTSPGRWFAKHFTSEAVVRLLLKTAFFDPRNLSQETVERVALLNRRQGNRDGALKCRDAGLQQLLPAPELARGIETPALIVWGRQDKWVPLENGLSLNGALKGSVLKVIEQSGHLPMEEQPLPTAAAIRKFLDL